MRIRRDLKRLQRHKAAIEAALASMTAEERDVVEAYYWGRNTLVASAQLLGVPLIRVRRTRDRVVGWTAKTMGWA